MVSSIFKKPLGNPPQGGFCRKFSSLYWFLWVKMYKNVQTKSSLKIGSKTNTSLLSGHPSQECLFSFFKKLQPLSIS